MRECPGQAVWPSHLGRQYAVQVGTTLAERGLASAALYDGTLLLGGDRDATGFIRLQSRENALVWDALFQPTPTGGSCRVMGLAAVNPWTTNAERRLAFAAGSFVGEVDFLDLGPHSSTARVGFVARGEAFPGSPALTGLAVFESTGQNEALCVATGPACGIGGSEQKFGETQCFSGADLLAVGGYFTAPTSFGLPLAPLASAGGEDGSSTSATSPSPPGTRSGSAAPGTTASPASPSTASARASSSRGPSPRPSTSTRRASACRACAPPPAAPTSSWPDTDRPRAPPRRLELEWVYTTGGAGDDAGAGVAVDSAGNAYAAGHVRSAGGLDDVIIVRLDAATTGSAAWVRQVQGPQDERATGVAVDGLDCALVSGWYECTTLAEGLSRGTPSASSTPFCLVDFDPGPGQDWRGSAGGKDAFLLRLRPDASYDGCRTWGGAQDDLANSVAADPLSWGSVAVGGTFGNPGAAPGYQLTLDPSSPPLVLTGAGGSDAYLFALEPVPGSAPLKAQLTLVLDNSGSVLPTEAAAMCAGLADALVASDPLFPNSPPIVRTDKTAAINVILHSVGHQSSGPAAVSLVPWTVIDGTTLPLLRARLLNLVRPPTADNVFAPAITLARSRLVGSRFNNLNVYQTLLLLADGLPADGGNIPAARAAALSGAFDQLNTLVVFDDSSEPGWTRTWALDSLTASIWAPLIVLPGEAPPPANENNLGWAARVPMDPLQQTGWFSPDYATVIGINLARSTRCPGDFDRNGVRNDDDVFRFGFLWPQRALQADLNFGNQWGPTDLDLDTQKLRTERAVPCP